MSELFVVDSSLCLFFVECEDACKIICKDSKNCVVSICQDSIQLTTHSQDTSNPACPLHPFYSLPLYTCLAWGRRGRGEERCWQLQTRDVDMAEGREQKVSAFCFALCSILHSASNSHSTSHATPSTPLLSLPCPPFSPPSMPSPPLPPLPLLPSPPLSLPLCTILPHIQLVCTICCVADHSMLCVLSQHYTCVHVCTYICIYTGCVFYTKLCTCTIHIHT